jgi:hypothetical protein
MLKQTTNDNFGFWHSLLEGSGISGTVDAAKKKDDWLPFNLARKNIAELAVELFGNGENDGDKSSWMVKTDNEKKIELFRFGAEKDGQMWVEMWSEADELSEMKLHVSGMRFMHELIETAKSIVQEKNPDLWEILNDYPEDMYALSKKQKIVLDGAEDDMEGSDDDLLDKGVMKPRFK